MTQQDWLDVLGKQGEFAKKLAIDVPKALMNPELTLDEAQSLYKIIDKAARDFDGVIEAMEEFDLDDSLFDAAENLEGIFSELHVVMANKVRTMQGLKPIEMPE